MKNILIILLILIAILMLIVGINASMLPPALTGVGFIVIALLFLKNK